MTWDTSNPPTTARPSGRSDSAPVPNPNAIGSVPINAVMVVIIIGRKGRSLSHEGLGIFVAGPQRQRGRTQGQIEDRLVGGIDFSVRRGSWHIRRQLRRCPSNRRLDVLGSGIDVTAQVESQGDLGEAPCIR